MQNILPQHISPRHIKTFCIILTSDEKGTLTKCKYFKTRQKMKILGKDRVGKILPLFRNDKHTCTLQYIQITLFKLKKHRKNHAFY